MSSSESHFFLQSSNFFIRVPISSSASQFLHNGYQFLHTSPNLFKKGTNFFTQVPISESQFFHQVTNFFMSPNIFIRVPISSSESKFLHFGPDFFNRVLTTSSGSLFHSPNFFHRVPISSSGSHFQSLNLFIRVTISSLGSQFQSLQFLHQSPNFFIRVFFRVSISGTGVDMLTCQLSCLIALCLAAELEWKNKNEEKNYKST